MVGLPRFLVGLAALALFASTATAQDDRPSTPRGPIAERWTRFRRSLAAEFAPDEPVPHVAPHAPNPHVHSSRPKKSESAPSTKKTESAPPRMTSQTASKAKTEAEITDVAVKPAPKKTATSSRRTAARSHDTENEEADDVLSVSEGPIADEVEEPEVALIPLHESGAEPEDDKPVASLARPHSAKTGKAEKHTSSEGGGDSGPLFTRTTPRVTLRATGPRRLAVGQAAEYKLTITNEGDQPAGDLVIMVSLPDSAELASVRPTTGTVDRAPSGSALQWAIRSLAARKHEELALRIVPHDSAALALDVRCGCAAVSAKATLDVQEAKLALAVEGASEVHCGEREIYRLVISNPGNGAAENTVIHLLPLPPEEGNPSMHRIGTLMAGESKVVEIELVARQGGKLTIQARATADGGLTAAASEDVAVRQAGIQVEVVGPTQQYAGTPATYRVRVRNPGDAPARKVKVVATLPEGSECVAASHDGKIDVKHGRTTWSLSSLAAGTEQLFTVKCLVKAPGENRIEVSAQADGDLKHTNLAKTDVVAVADLVLDIADPSGAVPVGEDSVYEVRVRNRGDKAAEGVDLTASFSKGVEPISVDGMAHSMSDDGVVFQTMPSLGPGQEKILKIHAKASAPGSHRFRVELQCKSLGTKLTEEETTLYYADASERSQEGESMAEESTSEPAHVAAPKRLKELR
jgi:uncharacterized repeat protein (TIGR01451 family)